MKIETKPLTISKPTPMLNNHLSNIMLRIDSVESGTPVQTVALRLLNQHNLDFIPVVDNCKVAGIIWRRELIDKLARPYQKELNYRKSINHLMDFDPIVVDINTPVEDLSRQITDGDPNQHGDAFIITQHGEYLGCGRFIDLLRLITDLKVQNARYANPLSGLPGNVPIQRHLKNQIEQSQGFCVIYVDVDHFKPYNDFYSYDEGDEIIRQLSTIIQKSCTDDHDFIGHIGGDDFMIVQGNTTSYRDVCEDILTNFNQIIQTFYQPQDVEQGGIHSINRHGESEFFPMMSLSLGVLVVPPGLVAHQQKIAGLATKAKKQAKQAGGNIWSVIEAQNDDEILSLNEGTLL